MSTLRKAWITPHGADLCSLTLRSERIDPDYARVKARENIFPAKDPTHHVVVIELLDDEDLLKIKEAIEEYLKR